MLLPSVVRTFVLRPSDVLGRARVPPVGPVQIFKNKQLLSAAMLGGMLLLWFWRHALTLNSPAEAFIISSTLLMRVSVLRDWLLVRPVELFPLLETYR